MLANGEDYSMVIPNEDGIKVFLWFETPAVSGCCVDVIPVFAVNMPLRQS